MQHFDRALKDALERLRSGHHEQIAALEGSAGWHQLDATQQRTVLDTAGLVLPEDPDVSTSALLLAALNAHPLGSLDERVQALPAKAQAARREIAAIVDPAPKVATVQLASATLKTESDVDAYLMSVRAQLMQHIDAGETVIT